MADFGEVSTALAATVNSLINTYGAPVPVAVITGWPLPNDLKVITDASKALVSVYPQPGGSTNVTRFQWDAEPFIPPVITLTAMLAGGFIEFGGTVTLPLNVAIFAGGKSYGYAASAGDTVASIVQQLVYLVQNDFPVAFTPTSLVFTHPPIDLAVHLGGMGWLIRENARRKQLYQITVWTKSGPIRIAVAKSFEPGLYGLNSIVLADGTAGMLFSERSFDTDAGEVDNFYRRDIVVSVEYGITELIPAWSIIAAEAPVTH